MAKINLEKTVKNPDVGLTDEPGPDEELVMQVLTALYHIGTQSKDEKGFWIRAGQIVDWLKANNYITTPIKVGHTLNKDLTFNTPKKGAHGISRWIDRTRLELLIEKFNDGEIDSGEIKGSGYEQIKREVFMAYLEGEDATELEYDPEAIAKASKEFNEIGEAEARKWLDEM